jgi:iron complex transport system ATP-binding protein
VITARDVTVMAGMATLVDGIALEVTAGELVALVGPNGAGKSTLLGALSGDRRIARGSVMLGGCDAHAATPAQLASMRAVLPQRSSLTLAFTATEVVCLADRAVSAGAARGHLIDVGLEALVDREYPTLSGGEQQRVQLARVLAQLGMHPSAALFLDEPTSALDPHHQLMVLRLARAAAYRGHPVVVVLHDLTLAARWADRVALLARGKLVACGPPTDVLQPATLANAYHAEFELLAGAAGPVIALRDGPQRQRPHDAEDDRRDARAER